MVHSLQNLLIYSLFFISIVRADTIVTHDGSQLQGKLLGIDSGVIRFETQFAGVLEIAQKKTQSIRTDQPVFVEFSSGNTLYGMVSSENANAVRVVAEDGEFRSTLDNVKASWHAGEDSPATRAYKAELAASRGKWSNEIAAEIAGTSGNTDSLNTGISFSAQLKSKDDKLSFYGSYSYSETENEVSTDKTKGGIRYDRNFYDHFFWYVRDEIGRDNTQDLDLYNLTGAGLGYDFIKTDIHNLSLNAGIAYRYESYSTGEDTSVPAGDIGLEHDYLFSFGKIYNELQFIPSFEDLGDYRINHESGIEFPLGNTDMKLRAGVGNRYHSQPTGDNERLDSNYFTRLVWSWK